ncbi:MAG: SusC/RagA family TonB-linked outer membrane protein [Prevotella sp.]|nr:SusC/RagA family TonB-linked outer membrane protein [Prevotella sp.]
MNRRNLKLAGLLCLSIAAQSVVSSPIYASAATNITQQQSKVSGTISDGNEPIVGASVIVKGDKSKGTITDLDGNFSLDVAPGTTLVISYIGYKTVEVKAAAGMKITLQEDNTSLSEVVVTALGIKRDRKALGYGLSEVKGEELTKAKETNVVNSLAGKVAGLVVQNTAGGASGSTRVMLRGNTEMTGNNQPLYVVDGVPLDNTNFASAGQSGGYDLGDGISAINPDDIETMTVLKGPAASALYGSRASHGVILITTKKAAKDKISVEYNGSFTIDSQLAKWDNIQQVYGAGYGGQFQESVTSGANASWGPKADDLMITYDDGIKRTNLMYPNNTSKFFRTGFTAQNTAVLSVSSGKTGMRFSVTDMRNNDILPNTNMNRDNFNLRVNTSAGPVDFDFTANYTRENVKNRPALGDAHSNIGTNLMTMASTIDQAWLKTYENPNGGYATWLGYSQYNINPYWDLYKNDNNSTKDVFRFTGKAIWNIMDGLKLQGTIGTDINNMNFSEYIAKDTPGTKAGSLTNQIFNNRTLNAELLLLYNHSWENFDLNATLGGNIFKVDNKTTSILGTNELMTGLAAIGNYSEQNVAEYPYKKQINSLYASASLGYKHTYYLEGTLRGDKSSTLPVNNNTYVYPSISGSIVFSEFIKNKKIINYGKIRASWAQVGSDTDPYQLSLIYENGLYKYPGYTVGMIANYTQPAKDLKPTMTGSFELGLEMKFFNNRLGLDVTYYNQNSTDQIIRLKTSESTGFPESLVNAGEIQNKGFEIALNGRILQYKDFAWDAGINFSKNINKVKKLVDGTNFFTLENAPWAGVIVGAEVGKNFGSIRGTGFQRNENGDVIVNGETGMPIVDHEKRTIGNASWDWTGGMYHTFTYKNFRLSAAFDVKVGADLYSMSMGSAIKTGKAMETLEGRDEWYKSEEERKAAGMTIQQWRNAGKARGYVVDGVVWSKVGTEIKDGKEVDKMGWVKNTIAVDPETYWRSVGDNDPAQFVYDNSYIKCREITFGYDFPRKWLGSFINALTVSFVARNPFIVWKNIPNIDPDSSYNTSGMGLEYGSLPSRRSYGINVNIKF